MFIAKVAKQIVFGWTVMRKKSFILLNASMILANNLLQECNKLKHSGVMNFNIKIKNRRSNLFLLTKKYYLGMCMGYAI